MDHCGGDDHEIQYVHSTLLFLLLVLSLEFCPLTPVALFLRFLEFIYFPRHRHPPTAFKEAYAFNADLSKWNTAAVTNMQSSTSTPPSCFCCCFFHLNSVHSLPLLFFLRFHDLIYFWILSTTAPTSSYSVHLCCCI